MDNPRSTASIAGHPIHPMLVPFSHCVLCGRVRFRSRLLKTNLCGAMSANDGAGDALSHVDT